MSKAAELWQTVLGELQLQLTKANYETWLKDTVGLECSGECFVVGVPNTFTAEWLQKSLSLRVKSSLAHLLGKETEVEFRIMGQEPRPALPAPAPHLDHTTRLLPSSGPPPVLPPRLNAKYTFDTFIVGSCNRLAYAAALGAAESPGRSYNPLFIYGGSGLGKTHLLHAIGQVAVSNGLRLLYVSAEQFTNEFIDAIAKKKTEDFRLKYRNADMLLVDDIHFIGGKEQTEEGFFHTFNELHNAGRQIAITSDRPPKSMPLLEARLRSRFEWGLIADIQPPDFETRLAILRTKAEVHGAVIPPEVLEFIARQVQDNIRQLEGALNRVIACARVSQAPLSVEIANQAISDITRNSPSRHITPAGAIEATARYYGLMSDALESQRRDQETALARHVAMYLIREDLHTSLAEIGHLFGGRDHTTVMHACEKIAREIEADTRLRRQVLEIRQSLYPRDNPPTFSTETSTNVSAATGTK